MKGCTIIKLNSRVLFGCSTSFKHNSKLLKTVYQNFKRKYFNSNFLVSSTVLCNCISYDINMYETRAIN